MGGLSEWVIVAGSAAITLWIAGAIHYDVCQGGIRGKLAAAAWTGAVVLLFFLWQPLWQPFAVLLVTAALFLAWWFRQKPSHDRDWEPAVAVLPRVVQTGDMVTIENVRNFEYRSLDDFAPRYEIRKFHLPNLKSADIVFFNWGSAWMSHPVLVFDFGPDGRVCMSIEVRYRKGQPYSLLRSMYRQQELIFVAADERDVVLRRTKHGGNQEAHLYNLVASPDELRVTFLDYVKAINDLYNHPRWYHGLCANCTTSFYWLPHSRFRLDWRILANAHLDWALYKSGRLDRSLPFSELRRIASLNDIANGAPEHGFGDHVRQALKRRRHER
jgi:hypothetical protein